MLHCKMQSNIEQNTVHVSLLCTTHWNNNFIFFFSFRTCFQKSCLNEQDIFKFDLLKRSTKSKTEELNSCT